MRRVGTHRFLPEQAVQNGTRFERQQLVTRYGDLLTGLVLAGARAGSALLTVAVSAENSSSAPLRRTRPISVE